MSSYASGSRRQLFRVGSRVYMGHPEPDLTALANDRAALQSETDRLLRPPEDPEALVAAAVAAIRRQRGFVGSAENGRLFTTRVRAAGG